jgi:bacteriorhodopsin
MDFVTFENLFEFTPMGYQIVSHILTLGYAAMAAALLYFVLTIKTVLPKYRISNVLSVVVMVSAFLLLFSQQQSWTNAFVYDASTNMYVRAMDGTDNFTNGYRYLNWLIDVPMLLTQILFVVELSKAVRNRIMVQFFFAGPLMILTGYVGQFYQSTAQAPWLIWGAISTVFFIWVIVLIRRVIYEGSQNLPADAKKLLRGVFVLFLVSWMLYPGAYLMPVFLNNAAGVVGRQLSYTLADILSKVIYGVMLTQVANLRSNAEGYEMPAAA